MVEREHGAGRPARDEVATQPAGLDPGQGHNATGSPASHEDERHNRVMASAQRVMRKHRNVFAALAK